MSLPWLAIFLAVFATSYANEDLRKWAAQASNPHLVNLLNNKNEALNLPVPAVAPGGLPPPAPVPPPLPAPGIQFPVGGPQIPASLGAIALPRPVPVPAGGLSAIRLQQLPPGGFPPAFLGGNLGNIPIPPVDPVAPVSGGLFGQGLLGGRRRGGFQGFGSRFGGIERPPRFGERFGLRLSAADRPRFFGGERIAGFFAGRPRLFGLSGAERPAFGGARLLRGDRVPLRERIGGLLGGGFSDFSN